MQVVPLKIVKEIYNEFSETMDEFWSGTEKAQQKVLKLIEDNKFNIRKEEFRMNGKQAARAAAKRIEDLEIMCARMSRDIKRYNEVIDSMIAGGDPCDYCEDCKECHLSDHGKGCKLWMLSYEEEDDHGISDPTT